VEAGTTEVRDIGTVFAVTRHADATTIGVTEGVVEATVPARRRCGWARGNRCGSIEPDTARWVRSNPEWRPGGRRASCA
jgi:ferric-dicitrate binding protein FerR (iron transport regulator)